MVEGSNFQRLRSEILKRSAATAWEIAKTEWCLTEISQADEPETCLCGHFPIIELCTITNPTTDETVVVGNVCVKRFLGLRSDLIFSSIKRIEMHIDKSLGEQATLFFYENNMINILEYKFQKSTMRKRKLTERQIEIRRKINTKVIAAVKRRGLK
jgi:hypothetical protein